MATKQPQVWPDVSADLVDQFISDIKADAAAHQLTVTVTKKDNGDGTFTVTETYS
jgi:hypothetical protein